MHNLPYTAATMTTMTTMIATRYKKHREVEKNSSKAGPPLSRGDNDEYVVLRERWATNSSPTMVCHSFSPNAMADSGMQRLFPLPMQAAARDYA